MTTPSFDRKKILLKQIFNYSIVLKKYIIDINKFFLRIIQFYVIYKISKHIK